MTAPQPATPGSDSVREHASNPDQLMAHALGVCWHSPTSDRWPCTPAATSPAALRDRAAAYRTNPSEETDR